MNRRIAQIKHLNLIKWLILIIIIGTLSGSASAIFLISLDWVTNYRENNKWIIFFLPLAGYLIGWIYHQFGKEVAKGNNLLLEEFEQAQKRIPLKMAPLVLLGTLATHLFGGSAGREGTAVQMGGAIADQFTHRFKLNAQERRTILLMGIGAGFASVFGTPLAGTIFALEIVLFQQHRKYSFIPVLLSAYLAHYVCLAWKATHTHYHIDVVTSINTITFLWLAISGIIFGLCSMFFSSAMQFFKSLFSKIKNPPIRPFFAGIIIAMLAWQFDINKYLGLGIPTIKASFSEQMNIYDFLLKILFTAFTLSSGFKGGEVTPLFYIGATLGNVLIWFIPLPMSLLAGLGFVSVFAGATHAPFACTIMGIELFGIEVGPHLFITCFFAFLFSGKKGIYSAQKIPFLKKFFYNKIAQFTHSTKEKS
jgi:H+/Cl- antiporter ClcA